MDETGALQLLAQAPPSIEDWSFLARSWLGRAETIGAAYQAWEELRSQYKNAIQNYTQQRASLQLHGEFVLGAAQRAHAEGFEENAATHTGLAPSAAKWIEQSRQRLKEISQIWAEAQSQMTRCFEQASLEIEQEIVRRADKTLAAVRPRLHLTIHHLGKEHCILQFERMDELTSVLLSRLISGKVPTHYAFLFDDSVSQLDGAADALYVDDLQPMPIQQPCWPSVLKLLNDKEKLSAPWKGHIPIACEGELLWILKQKGVVMEVEQATMKEAQACEVLEATQAQWMVARFLKWVHEGKIELKLQPNSFSL